MTTHRLKCWPEFFGPFVDGSKPFEIRRDDRDFQVGDLLVNREFNPETETFTGRESAPRTITYLTRFGLAPGYVCLGLGPVSVEQKAYLVIGGANHHDEVVLTRESAEEAIRLRGDGSRLEPLFPCLPAPPASVARAAGDPSDLRAAGWAVAVHNDYRLAGVPHTFWLFTHGTNCAKGEGRTDAEALNLIRLELGFAQVPIDG